MTELLTPDLCVIGAGAAGLTVAAGAAQMGASVVLLERGEMGGECLNAGCVPSKALIAAARAVHAAGRAARFGLAGGNSPVDFTAVMAHVRGAIETIAPNDSEARFQGLGVRVIRSAARFTGPDRVQADGFEIKARRFVVATGSRPALPPIPGIEDLPILTNETVFQLTEQPRHLLILGGGPIGVELGQAFRRLGSAVTLVEAGSLLGREDPELAEVLRSRLRAEGVTLIEGVAARAARAQDGGMALDLADGSSLAGSHLLCATGRQAAVEGLGLDRAGVAFTRQGIAVDRALRTTNRRIYAVGDAAGGGFTHVAGWHGGLVLMNALFRLPVRARAPSPRVVYGDPELAQVGLTEAEAREQGLAFSVLRFPVAELDRAVCDGEAEGLAKMLVDKRGRVLGCGLCAPRAAELIQPVVLAMAKGLTVSDLARTLAAYPSYAELVKRCAGTWFAPKLFSERTKTVVRWLKCLPG